MRVVAGVGRSKPGILQLVLSSGEFPRISHENKNASFLFRITHDVNMIRKLSITYMLHKFEDLITI